MLTLKNIKKSYTTGDFTQVALDGVSVNFRKNEFVAILGPSGSGKTACLNVIGGQKFNKSFRYNIKCGNGNDFKWSICKRKERKSATSP